MFVGTVIKKNLSQSTLTLAAELILNWTADVTDRISWKKAPEANLGGLEFDNIMIGDTCWVSARGMHPTWTMRMVGSLSLVP